MNQIPDSSSPIDPSLSQLVCTSWRLIKINPAAKTASKCFCLLCFSPRCLLTFFKGLQNAASSGRWRKCVWNPNPAAGPPAHDRRGWFHSCHVVRAQRVIDAHGWTQTQQSAVCFDFRLIICQRGDGSPSISTFPSKCSSYLRPNKALPALLDSTSHHHTSLLPVWRSSALDGWSMRLIRPGSVASAAPPDEVLAPGGTLQESNSSGASAPGLHPPLLFYFLWH